MIHVATAAWAHTAFDLAAWGAGLGLSTLLYRWRLKGLTAEVAGKVGGGYFAALVAGAIPGKVPGNIRPIVTAGLAKDVDEGKKYAGPIQAGTRTGPSRPFPVLVSAPMIQSRPAVATTTCGYVPVGTRWRRPGLGWRCRGQ